MPVLSIMGHKQMRKIVSDQGIHCLSMSLYGTLGLDGLINEKHESLVTESEVR